MAADCPVCAAPLCVTCGGCDDDCGTCECYDSTDELGLDELQQYEEDDEEVA